MAKDDGVQFPVNESGKRSSLAVNKEIWADAVRGTHPDLATTIDRSAKWRQQYVGACKDATIESAASHQIARQIAADGLDSARSRLVFERDGKTRPLIDALSVKPAFNFDTETVVGKGKRVHELVVPFHEYQLSGDRLRRRLADWVHRGIIEPSASNEINAVIDNPEWLNLAGRRVVLIGAGAQTSPLPVLSSWGAEVIALDLPREDIQKRILDAAKAGASTVHVPIVPGQSGRLEKRAGANIIEQAPEIAKWLGGFKSTPLVLGFYVYADGPLHVQATMATDLIARKMREAGQEFALAFAGTPSECYLVPQHVVDDSDRRRRSRYWRALELPLRTVTFNKMYAPAYREILHSAEGESMGLSDAIVSEQGPNYLLAKRLQRWSAIDAWANDADASFNVAPPTWTVSVTKNKLLAAGYYGAKKAGLEVFEPDTMGALMTALMVYDLHVGASKTRHPELEITHAGIHGGYWRTPYEIRTTLLYSGVVGLPEAYLPDIKFR